MYGIALLVACLAFACHAHISSKTPVQNVNNQCLAPDGTLHPIKDKWPDRNLCRQYLCRLINGKHMIETRRCEPVELHPGCYRDVKPGVFPACCPKLVCSKKKFHFFSRTK